MKKHILIAIAMLSIGVWMADDLLARGGRGGGGGGGRGGGGARRRRSPRWRRRSARWRRTPAFGRTHTLHVAADSATFFAAIRQPAERAPGGGGQRPGGSNRPAMGNLPTPGARPGSARPAELDPAPAAGRATSPTDLVELAPLARLQVPALDRATLLAAAHGPAPAHVLAVVGHRLAILETSSIWVGPAAVAPVFEPAQQRPAAPSPAALRQLSYTTRRADLTLARDRKEAGDRAPVTSQLTRDPDKAAAVFNDRQPCQAKVVAVFKGQQLGRAKAAPASSDPQPAQVKTATEFSGLRLGLVKTAAGSCDLMAIAPDAPMAFDPGTVAFDPATVAFDPATVAFDPGTAIGPTIAPIASTTATNGTTGVKTISPKSTTTGKTIGATTTIGLTTNGGAIITIRITIGTPAKTGGVGPRSAP